MSTATTTDAMQEPGVNTTDDRFLFTPTDGSSGDSATSTEQGMMNEVLRARAVMVDANASQAERAEAREFLIDQGLMQPSEDNLTAAEEAAATDLSAEGTAQDTQNPDAPPPAALATEASVPLPDESPEPEVQEEMTVSPMEEIQREMRADAVEEAVEQETKERAADAAYDSALHATGNRRNAEMVRYDVEAGLAHATVDRISTVRNMQSNQDTVHDQLHAALNEGRILIHNCGVYSDEFAHASTVHETATHEHEEESAASSLYGESEVAGGEEVTMDDVYAPSTPLEELEQFLGME